MDAPRGRFNIQKLFELTKKYYSLEKFYISSLNLNGIHLGVYPDPKQFVFSEYVFGNSTDMKKIVKNATQSNIFKSFYCSMCTIEEPDNISFIDDCNNLQTEQNLAILINQKVEYGNIKFLISGTYPQYYYNHLMLSTAEHYSTYMIFDDFNLFKSVFEFSADLAVQNKNAKLVFNGNFGSDIWHFHVHITDTVISYVEEEIKNILVSSHQNYENNGKLGVVNYKAVASPNINELYKRVFELTRLIYTPEYISRRRYLSAVFRTTFRNGYPIYTAFLVTGNRRPPTIGNIPYQLFFPAAALKTGEGITENIFAEIQQFIINNDCYTNWSFIKQVPQPKQSIRAEFFEHSYRKNCKTNFLNHPDVQAIFNTVDKCISDRKNCGEENADVFATYKYAMSLAFICRAQNLINSGERDEVEQKVYKLLINDSLYLKLALKSGISYLTNNYNIKDTKYLFLKGPVAAKIVEKSFNNFNLLTSKEVKIPKDRLVEQSESASGWINNNSRRRIGNPSAVGIVYSYNLSQNPNVEFVIKTLNPSSASNETFKELIISEFAKGIKINKLREHIPNFIITLGGFECYSNDAEPICTGFSADKVQFLMLEKINNAITFQDYISNTQITVLPIVLGIQQIAAALYYAQRDLHFTHYDLHTGNIMVTDLTSFAGGPISYKYKFGDDVLEVPAYVNCSIIDYGSVYVKDLNKYPLDAEHVENYGMTTDRPNFNRDIYSLVMHSFWAFLFYKDFQTIEHFYQNDNPLKYIVIKLFDSYPSIFHADAFNIIMRTYGRNYPTIADRRSYLIKLFNSSRKDNKYYLYLPANQPFPATGMYKSQKQFIQDLNSYIKTLNIKTSPARKYKWGDYGKVGCFVNKVNVNHKIQIEKLKKFINTIRNTPPKQSSARLKSDRPKQSTKRSSEKPKQSRNLPSEKVSTRQSPKKSPTIVSDKEKWILDTVKEANLAFKKRTNCVEIIEFYERVWTLLANEKATKKGEAPVENKVIRTKRDFKMFLRLIHSDKQAEARKTWADQMTQEVNSAFEECKLYLPGK